MGPRKKDDTIKLIDLNDKDAVKEFIVTTDSGRYISYNDKNEELIVTVAQNERLEIETFQTEGWIYKEIYGLHGTQEDSFYSDKWKR